MVFLCRCAHAFPSARLDDGGMEIIIIIKNITKEIAIYYHVGEVMFGRIPPYLTPLPLSLSMSALCVYLYTGNTVKDITHSCVIVERGGGDTSFLPLAHTGNGADGSVELGRTLAFE